MPPVDLRTLLNPSLKTTLLLASILGAACAPPSDGSQASSDQAASQADWGQALASANECSASLRAGSYTIALSRCSEAIESRPESRLSYFNRGYAHYKLGDHHSALLDFDQALTLKDPSDASSEYGVTDREARTLYYRALAKRGLGDEFGFCQDLEAARVRHESLPFGSSYQGVQEATAGAIERNC